MKDFFKTVFGIALLVVALFFGMLFVFAVSNGIPINSIISEFWYIVLTFLTAVFFAAVGYKMFK